MKYHIRRMDRAITDPAKLERILMETRFITVAMCRDNIPYLVSISHFYDPSAKRLYFHCATEGKKMDFWRANPRVWGQAIIDHGYVEGECNHLYVMAMFDGTVHIAEANEEKRRIMNYMFDRQEKKSHGGEVDPHKERITKDAELGRAAVGWIAVEEITGKRSKDITF